MKQINISTASVSYDTADTSANKNIHRYDRMNHEVKTINHV